MDTWFAELTCCRVGREDLLAQVPAASSPLNQSTREGASHLVPEMPGALLVRTS